MKEKRSFVADIRNTPLRRAAMILVLPWIALPRLVVTVVAPTLCHALYWSLVEAFEAFCDRWRWQFDTKTYRLIFKGLAAMWAKNWNDE